MRPDTYMSHRYEQLVKLYPDSQEYKLYYAQSLYKASSEPSCRNPAHSASAVPYHSLCLSRVPTPHPTFEQTPDPRCRQG